MELIIAVIGAIATLLGAVAALWKAASKAKIAKAKLQSIEQTIIESLGSEDLSVRINSIHKLHELAIKKPNQSKEILEILCAHLRSQTSKAEYQEKYKTEPSEEISSLLELLVGKESELRKVVEESDDGEYVLNFRKAFLNGANFHRAWLEGADLSHSELQRASFVEAQMQRAKLAGVQMQGACLLGAQMQGISLFEAQMQEAQLSGAQMQGAFLGKAKMQGTSLWDTQMQGAWLSEAQMQGAELYMTQMQVAQLSKTQMQGASLLLTQMQGAWLQETQMQGASLSGVQMSEADLDHLNLCGVSDSHFKSLPALNAAADSSEDNNSYEKFKSHMESRRDKLSELDNTMIFSGVLKPNKQEYDEYEHRENIKEALRQAKQYIAPNFLKWFESKQDALQNLFDAGDEPGCEIPEEGIVAGVLANKKIDQFIEEYEKAMAWKTEDAESD